MRPPPPVPPAKPIPAGTAGLMPVHLPRQDDTMEVFPGLLSCAGRLVRRLILALKA